MFDRSALTKGMPKRRVLGRDVCRKGSEIPFWAAALGLSAVAAWIGWDATCVYMRACTGVGGVLPGAIALAIGLLASYFFALANCYAGLPRAPFVPVVGAAAVFACGMAAQALREVLGQAASFAPAAIVVAAILTSLTFLLYRIVKPY